MVLQNSMKITGIGTAISVIKCFFVTFLMSADVMAEISDRTKRILEVFDEYDSFCGRTSEKV